MKQSLKGIPETTLMSLWCKAQEARHPHPIMKDTHALAIYKRLDYDFSKYDGNWLLQLNTAIGAKLLDAAALNYLDRYPSGMVINVGAGLDARFQRVDNGRVQWFDVDLPQAMEVRRQFFSPSRRNTMISGSVFDDDWIEQLPKERDHVLILVDDLFPYCPAYELRELLDRWVMFFPNAELVFQATTPQAARRERGEVHSEKARLQWGIRSGREIEAWHESVHFLKEWIFSDYFKDRWQGWWRWTTYSRWLAGKCHNRVIQLRFS